MGKNVKRKGNALLEDEEDEQQRRQSNNVGDSEAALKLQHNYSWTLSS